MLQMIMDAIKNRDVICFNYDGIARLAHPAAVGKSKTGKDTLRCYQVGGGHKEGGHAWDLCTIAKMSNFRLAGEKFVSNPPGYKKGDKGMIEIYAEL